MKNKEMLTIEQLAAGSSSDKIITLKSPFKTKMKVQPARDPARNWYAGVERLSDEQKRGLDFWVEPSTTLTLTDGMEFDLNNPVDKLNWEWVKELKEVVASVEEYQSSRQAVYYVHLEGREARQENKNYSKTFKAMQFIMEDSPVNYENRAKLLGIDMTGESPEVIKAFLLKMASNKSTADQIINAYNNEAMSIHLTVLSAIDKGVIIKNETNLFEFNYQILGMNVSQCVKFLSVKKNADVLTAIETQLEPTKFESKEEKTK